MRRRDTALAVLVALIWGTNFVAIRTGLDSVPPLLFLAVRFVVVCVPAVFLVRRPGLPWRDLALIGLFTSLGQFALMYLALHLGMPPGLSSLVLQAQVLLTVVIAAALAARAARRSPQRLGVALGGAGLLTIAVGRGLSAPAAAARRARAGRRVVGRRQRADPPGGRPHRAGRRARRHGLVGARRAAAGPRPLVRVRGTGRPSARRCSHLQWPAVASTAYTAYLSSLVGYGIWNTLLEPPPGREGDAVRDARAGLRHGRGGGHAPSGERPTLLEAMGGAVLLAGVAVAVLRTAPVSSTSPST